MYTLIIHLPDVSTKYYGVYTALLHFLSNYKLPLGIWLGKITSWAFFLDGIIVGNDINQVYGKEQVINVQDKPEHTPVS